jgi:hypothetical protein
MGQGYLWSRPVDLVSARELLSASPVSSRVTG